MMYANARQALEALLAADIRLNQAQDVLCQAKRERGAWNVNPLKNNHPAVIEKRAATQYRQDVLEHVTEFLR